MIKQSLGAVVSGIMIAEGRQLLKPTPEGTSRGSKLLYLGILNIAPTAILLWEISEPVLSGMFYGSLGSAMDASGAYLAEKLMG